MSTAFITTVISATGGVIAALVGRKYHFKNSRDNLRHELEFYNQLPDFSKAKAKLLVHIERQILRDVSNNNGNGELKQPSLVIDVASFIALAGVIALVVYNFHIVTIRNLWTVSGIVFLGMFVLGSMWGFSASSILYTLGNFLYKNFFAFAKELDEADRSRKRVKRKVI